MVHISGKRAVDSTGSIYPEKLQTYVNISVGLGYVLVASNEINRPIQLH
jgi:hypothetical protein